MMGRGVVFLLFFTFAPKSMALFGGDTAMLVELVTTTASQLNELEKLVTNAEKYTKQMQRYNELTQDEYFRAQRVLYVAEALAAKKEAKDLGELNWAIRELKYSMGEMRGLMKEYAMIKGDEKKAKQEVKIGKRLNERKAKVAKHQVASSMKASTNSRTNQLTAQNTALIYEQNVSIHNTQLEILESLATTNRLLAEELEDKRLKDMQKTKNYGLGEK